MWKALSFCPIDHKLTWAKMETFCSSVHCRHIHAFQQAFQAKRNNHCLLLSPPTTFCRINVFFFNNAFFDQRLAFRVPFYSMSACEINLVRRIRRDFFREKIFANQTLRLMNVIFLRALYTLGLHFQPFFPTWFQAWCTSAVADFFDHHTYNSSHPHGSPIGARILHTRPRFFRPSPSSRIFRICQLATIASCNLRRSPTRMDANTGDPP